MRIKTSYVQSFYTGDTKFWNTINSKDDCEAQLVKSNKDSYLIHKIHFRIGTQKLNNSSDKYVQFKTSYYFATMTIVFTYQKH